MSFRPQRFETPFTFLRHPASSVHLGCSQGALERPVGTVRVTRVPRRGALSTDSRPPRKLSRSATLNSQPFYRAEDLYTHVKGGVSASSRTATLPIYGAIEGAGDMLSGDFVFVHR